MAWQMKRWQALEVEALYKILTLRSAVFVVEQNCIYQDCDGKDRNAYHLFLEEEDKVIACLRILDKGVSYDEIAIGRVVVDQSARGRGLARKMMQQAITFIEKELKEEVIKLQAQAYLVDFYGSLGFRAVSEVYLEDGIPHIDMQRQGKCVVSS